MQFGSGLIIHAEGVRSLVDARDEQYHPRRRRAEFHHPRAVRAYRLSCRIEPIEFLTQILKVIGSDIQFEHFLDYREEVSSERMAPSG